MDAQINAHNIGADIDEFHMQLCSKLRDIFKSLQKS